MKKVLFLILCCIGAGVYFRTHTPNRETAATDSTETEAAPSTAINLPKAKITSSTTETKVKNTTAKEDEIAIPGIPKTLRTKPVQMTRNEYNAFRSQGYVASGAKFYVSPSKMIDFVKSFADIASTSNPKFHTGPQGTTLGVAVNSVTADPILDELEIQNTDVLTALNGVVITNQQTLDSAFHKFPKSMEINFELMRGEYVVPRSVSVTLVSGTPEIVE